MKTRGTTLRILYHAQLARRKDEWERASCLMSVVIASGFRGHWVEPWRLNPLHEQAADTPELREMRTRMQFDMLEAGLQQMTARAMGLGVDAFGSE